jgi:hypothetical protein
MHTISICCQSPSIHSEWSTKNKIQLWKINLLNMCHNFEYPECVCVCVYTRQCRWLSMGAHKSCTHFEKLEMRNGKCVPWLILTLWNWNFFSSPQCASNRVKNSRVNFPLRHFHSEKSLPCNCYYSNIFLPVHTTTKHISHHNKCCVSLTPAEKERKNKRNITAIKSYICETTSEFIS